MTVATQQQPRRRARSAGALFLGFVSVFVLSLGTDQVLHVLEVYPPWGQPMRSNALCALALSYRTIYGALGSWIAARLAPSRPMWHALLLGIIGTGFATLGAVATIPMDLGPAWYPVALVLVTMPGAWVGGLLQQRGMQVAPA